RESRKIYKTKMLELVAKDVADGTPHNAMTDIFAPDGVTRINNAKELLLGTTGKSPVDIQKGTAAWDELRWGWLRDQVDSSQSLDEIPLGSRLTKALKDMGDALPAMFSPEELAGINKMAKKMRLVERGATTGSGELIRFIQVGAAAGGRFGNKPGLAFAALGGPAVFARAMSKPNTHKLLLSNKIGQFITVMANTKLEMEKQRKAIQRLDVRDATRKIEQEFTGSGP
ncbi:MAG: hypothetical protein KAS32_02955, partial [Candidatus Peribacteraceae bacterium]|nr:hypothetical protein [Candidatus Peribacteraceae bacterium]